MGALACPWGVAAMGALLSACGGTPGEFAVKQQQQTLEHSRTIINGQDTEAGEFPAVGAVLIRVFDLYGASSSNLCTGTLIAPDVVLSAAHCLVTYDRSSKLVFYFSLARDVARAGVRFVDIPEPAYEVAEAIAHPDYRPTRAGGLGHTNDVSLLLLRAPVPQVPPSELLAAGDGALQEGTPVSIVGYGLDGPPQGRDHQPWGIKRDARSVVNEIGAYEMQVGDRAPTPQKCVGDSGGPSYVDTAGGARLAGITSRAYDGSGCRRGGIDVLLAPLRGWVVQTLKDACASGHRIGC